jgi:hypothetical protein
MNENIYKTTVLRTENFEIFNFETYKKNYTRLKIFIEILRVDGLADVVESKKSQTPKNWHSEPPTKIYRLRSLITMHTRFLVKRYLHISVE